MKTNTDKAVLTDRDTLKEVVDCLTENLSIKTQGDCEPTDLFNILVGAASKADTIENTASTLKNSFSSRKIRYHLNNKFKSFKYLETQLNQGLISKLPRRIKKRKHKLAIDLNLIPYYGKPTIEEQDYIYRASCQKWYLFILCLRHFIFNC